MRSKDQSQTHSRIGGRRVRPFNMTQVTDQAVSALARIGIVFDHSVVTEQLRVLNMAGAFGGAKGAMDSAFTAPITNASIPTPIQFLQNWLPGFVKVLTAARKIDDMIGLNTVGNWEDQEIVQGIVEPAGTATEYGDTTNIPLVSWNTNFEARTIVRGELGLQVGLLEEGRSAAMRLNSADVKRQQAAVGLEIFRNAVGFYGWNSGGGNRTFGFLNDPQLLPAVTAPSGGWATSDFKGICGDIRAMVILLRTQSQDQIDPEKIEMTLGLPTRKVDYLSFTTDFGISVRDWITQTYPKMRIVSAPEMQGDVDTTDMAYLFADDIDSSVDGSSDGGETFAQLVQSKFVTLGVEKRSKSYLEDFSNATAGTMCKRPWAVTRFIGI